MKMLIKNGHVVNADSESVCDILVEDGIIKEIGEGIAEKYSMADATSDMSCAIDEIIDATGKYVMPGFIDLHVHFREPAPRRPKTWGKERQRDLPTCSS